MFLQCFCILFTPYENWFFFSVEFPAVLVFFSIFHFLSLSSFLFHPILVVSVVLMASHVDILKTFSFLFTRLDRVFASARLRRDSSCLLRKPGLIKPKNNYWNKLSTLSHNKSSRSVFCSLYSWLIKKNQYLPSSLLLTGSYSTLILWNTFMLVVFRLFLSIFWLIPKSILLFLEWS